jgi:bla regulator protein blaR1
MNVDTTNHGLLALLWTHAWQILVLWSAVWVVTRWVARTRPHLAHALWAIVIIKCLIPPIVSSPIAPFSWLMTQLSHETPETPTNVSIQTVSIPSQQPHLDHSPAPTTRPKPTLEPIVGNQPIQFHSSLPVTGMVLGFWLFSVFALTTKNSFQVWQFKKRVRRSAVPASSSVTSLARELATKLKLKRSVEVCVVDDAIGPAAMGLFAPTVLLPQRAIEKLTHEELRTLIAHELIHIRRGDLIWSLIQVVTNCIWWFHPLVRSANQRLTDECERSCDEETIASLRCSPKTYSQCLLKILEWKHELHSCPALPGVRPLQITFDRMERIMTFKDGYERNPRRLWSVLLLALALFLPGARLSSALQESQPPSPALPSPLPAPAIQVALATDETVSRPNSTPVTHVYDVSPLVQRYSDESKVQLADAAHYIQTMLTIYERPAPIVDKVIYATPVAAALLR